MPRIPVWRILRADCPTCGSAIDYDRHSTSPRMTGGLIPTPSVRYERQPYSWRCPGCKNIFHATQLDFKESLEDFDELLEKMMPKDTEVQAYYVVWNESLRQVVQSPQTKFTYNDAIAEATRHSKANVGKRFAVLKAVKSFITHPCEPQVTSYVEIKVDDADKPE